MSSVRWSGRMTTAAAIAGGLVASLALPAQAHVSLNPREAPRGERARFDIRVPNERPDAGTVKVEVQMPEEYVVPALRVLPVAGWTYTIAKKTLATPIREEEREITEAVVSVTWQGGEIKPDEFMEFPVSMGPLPTGADELRFKAVQTYSSGEVVRWIEVAEPGKPEPEHPAPVVKLVGASGSREDPAAASPADATGESFTPGAGGPAAFALLLALIAVIMSMGALMAARSRNKPPAG